MYVERVDGGGATLLASKTTAYRKMMAGLSVFVNLLFSGGAYLAADRLIGSETMRGSFIKAGLFGKDLNKASEARV